MKIINNKKKGVGRQKGSWRGRETNIFFTWPNRLFCFLFVSLKQIAVCVSKFLEVFERLGFGKYTAKQRIKPV
mgnify:CR=1 FL=1